MRNIFILLFLFFFQLIHSQKPADTLQIKKDIAFAHYLLGKEQYEDAVFLIDNMSYKQSNPSICDTINYIKGWAFYNMKQLDSSSLYLLKVDNGTYLGKKAHFFAAYNTTFLGNRKTAEELIKKIPVPDSLQSLNELKALELGGIALLNRNYNEYASLKKTFSYSLYSLTEAEESLDKCHTELSGFKPKSKVIAGVMSAIIPGSGKMYAGKVGEGVSALFANAILASFVLENYRKAGPTKFKTIFFGSLFTIFYAGNVYGSIVSVQVSTHEFYSLYDKQVLFHIHIPLRTIFN
jgi:hypothetical protein